MGLMRFVRIRGRVVWFALIALIALSVVPSAAPAAAASSQPAGTSSFSLQFNSLPSAQGWTYFQGGSIPETSAFSVTGTSLIQHTVGTGIGPGFTPSPNYAMFGVVDGTQPFQLTVRARIVSYEGTGPFGFFFAVRTASPKQDYAIGFSPSGVVDGNGNGVAIDTTTFHTYVLRATPGGPYTLDIDGHFALGGTFDTNGGALNAVQFGDGNSQFANANAEVTQLEFSTGLNVCQAKATHVEMFDSHTLEIDVTNQFSNDPLTAKSLSATTNINGVALSSNSPLPPGSTGAQSESLFIDLAANNVPRFSANAQFSVTVSATEGATTCTGSAQAATVLLPVVIIPGIFSTLSGNGGDGTFPALESFLGSSSLLDSNVLGEPYTLRSSGTGYPTLYTLSYPVNTASFLEGAVQLNGLINQIKGLTYADKVNVVTHSKGGLVAREYLEGISGPGPSPVNQLIMAEPPNLGALAASWELLIPPNSLVNLRNLVPTWPWHRNKAAQPFAATPPNPELDVLNSMPMPSSVQYTLIYSTSNLTPWTETGHPGPGGLFFTDTPGDGIVPAFSMRGLEPDPNNPSQPPVLIPAFQGISINEVSIPGGHIGYLQQQSVMAEIASLVSN